MSLELIEQYSENLRDLGIKFSFGVVGGGSSLYLASALESRAIPYYPVAHEAAAVLMAGACCRDGKPSAMAIGIKGPGFINFLPGLLSNYYEMRPALTVSEAYGADTPNFRRHKRADHQSLCSSIVKRYGRVDGNIQTVRNIFEAAENEVPGPIHMDISNVIQENEELLVNDKLHVDNQALAVEDKVLKLIKGSAKPAVILGSLVTRKLKDIDWSRLKIPIVTTAAAKGCIDESTPFAGGVITGEIKELSPETTILKEADLIIAFGLRNTEVVIPRNYEAPLIIVDAVNDRLHDGFGVHIELHSSEITSVASHIFDALKEKEWGEEIVRMHWSEVEKDVFKEQWLPAVVFKEIQEVCKEEPVMCVDTGLFCIIAETIWKASKWSNFCGSSVGRFMGTAIPSAIGLALSLPENLVICVVGDGGIRPYFSEIRLAIAQKLSIVFILVADGQYGTIAASVSGRSVAEKCFTIKEYNWWRTVEAMGCPAVIVSNIRELSNTLNEVNKKEGPLFIETNFDPKKYIQMAERLR